MRAVVDRGGPCLHAPTSVRRTMLLVAAALTPATLFNLWLFGWPAIFLFIVTVGTAFLVEAGCLLLADRPLHPQLYDGSGLLTGWLLALSLPPSAPWWIGAVGAVIAVVVGKHIFGGLGQNPFNPAMVARVALLIAFPVPMTRFAPVLPLGSPGAPGFLDGFAVTFGGSGAAADAVSAATPLGVLKGAVGTGIVGPGTAAAAADAWSLAAGTVPGSLGETAAILLALGGLFLLLRRVITWHIPVAMIGSIVVLASLFHAIDPVRHADGLFHLLAGATVLGAFFIATDPVTSPVTPLGQLVFGLGCGVLAWVIRSFAGYPEGIAFAVLLMNAMTPLIDRAFRPRILGRTRRGDPIAPARKTR